MTPRRRWPSCWRSRSPTSSPAARRCASARCFTTSASRRRAGEIEGLRHLHRPRPGRRRDDRRALPPPTDQPPAQRPPAGARPAPPAPRLPGPRAAAVPPARSTTTCARPSRSAADVTLLTAADRLAARGEGPARERGDGRRPTSSWSARCCRQALAWHRGPAAPAAERRRARRRGRDRARPARWARSSRSCARPRSRARWTIAPAPLPWLVAWPSPGRSRKLRGRRLGP